MYPNIISLCLSISLVYDDNDKDKDGGDDVHIHHRRFPILHARSLITIMAIALRRRSLSRVFWLVLILGALRYFFFTPNSSESPQIRRQGVLEIVKGGDKQLDVQKHDFLQVRMGRDERPDFMSDLIHAGTEQFWNKYQMPL